MLGRMLSQIEEIRPIEVRGQTFLVTVLRVTHRDMTERLKMPKSQSLFKDYYVAYVYLSHLTNKMETLGNEQTYRKEKVIGIDTGHSYNHNMTLKAKKEDAFRQITNLIEKYLDLLGDLKKVVKAWE